MGVRNLATSEQQQLKEDFILVATHLPGMPMNELLVDLQLPKSKHAARNAMHDAAQRAAKAQREADLQAKLAANKAQREADLQAKLAAEKAQREADLQAKLVPGKAQHGADLEAIWAQHKVDLEAKLAANKAQREASLAAENAAHQRQLDALVPEGNVMWSLHCIVAGRDSFGLDASDVASLQALFGWTLSMSRAMHGGVMSMRAWLQLAGVDARQLEDQYQCVSQEADGERLVGATVESSGIPGVQKVVSQYERDRSSEPEKVTTSLLMYAPTHQLSGGKDVANTPHAAATPEQIVHAAIPTVIPQMYAQSPVLTGNTTPVHSIPLVLTPPRIQLLLRIARCFETSRGVQLTGVHGAGKSMLLQALAGVFPVGHPCDMLYIGNAKQLLDEPSVVFQQLMQSSGPTADARAVGNFWAPDVPSVDDKGSLEYNQDQSKAHSKGWGHANAQSPNTTLQWWYQQYVAHRPGSAQDPDYRLVNGTMYYLDKSFNQPTCGRVYIFDEVNELLEKMRAAPSKPESGTEADRQAAASKRAVLSALKSHLPWSTTFPLYHFRILASSPDGLREKAKHVTAQPFYELRPTRFDHLAAVVHAAPEYICPGLDRAKAFGDCESTSLLQAMHVCRALCGNMREVAAYLNSVKGLVSSAVPCQAGGSDLYLQRTKLVARCADMLAIARDKYTSKLARRLVQSYADNMSVQQPMPWEGRPYLRHVGDLWESESHTYQAALVNASMGVRTDPTSFHSEQDVLGLAVMPAFIKAMKEGLHKLLSGDNARVFKAVALSEPRKLLVDGAAMKSEVRRRLALQALSTRQWRLSALHKLPGLPSLQTGASEADRCSLEDLIAAQQRVDSARPMRSLKMVHQEFLSQALRSKHDLWLFHEDLMGPQYTPEVIEVQQSTANQTTIVDVGVRSAVDRIYKHGGCVLIQTADNFPGVDFLFVKSVGTHRSVTFVEATKSTLRKHAASTEYSTLEVSLKDLAGLTLREKLTAKHPDGRRYFGDQKDFDDDKWVETASQTAANFWLVTLGCPLRVKATIGESTLSTNTTKRESEQLCVSLTNSATLAEEGALTHEQLGVQDDEHNAVETSQAASATAVPTWDVSIVYVSGSPEQPQYDEYADLDCDFAYGVFLSDLVDAKSAWAAPTGSLAAAAAAGDAAAPAEV